MEEEVPWYIPHSFGWDPEEISPKNVFCDSN